MSKPPSTNKPLSYMTKLSSGCYMYRPEPKATTSTPSTTAKVTNPKIIIIAGWMEARDAHLAKYVDEYRTRYPSSTLILMKSTVKSIREPKVANRDAGTAVAVMRDILADVPTDNQPELFIHVFSNGGSRSLYAIYDLWTESSTTTQTSSDKTTNPQFLPEHVTIFDSCPSRNYSRHNARRAVMLGVPQSPIVFYYLMHIFLWVFGIWRQFQISVLGYPDEHVLWATRHNDLPQIKETRRTYIFGDADVLVSPEEVVEHATDAERKGFVVRKEFFKEGKHVSHVRVDPERYWKIVKETWEG